MKTMNFSVLLLMLILFSCKRKDKVIPEPEGVMTIFIDQKLSRQANDLFTKIRDHGIDREEGEKVVGQLVEKLNVELAKFQSKKYTPEQWVFPISGYSPAISLAGIDDIGYVPGRYSFFEGNSHGGHAALDLFIRDKDQNAVDDDTGEPVDILSMTGGIVLAIENKWDTASQLKGGLYCWILEAQHNYLLYYAHLKTITVQPGQVLKPGDIIGTCGRTGLNAWKKRSPTHLHLTMLNIADSMRPVNPYPFLVKSKLQSKF